MGYEHIFFKHRAKHEKWFFEPKINIMCQTPDMYYIESLSRKPAGKQEKRPWICDDLRRLFFFFYPNSNLTS